MAIKLRVKELIAIKERTEGRKLTTRVISAETGLNRGTVMSYMNNTISRMDLPVLEIWRDYFGVTVAELFVEVPRKPNGEELDTPELLAVQLP